MSYVCGRETVAVDLVPSVCLTQLVFYLETVLNWSFLGATRLHHAPHIVPYIPPEAIFHSRVIEACPVTTDCIVAMSSYENSSNNNAVYHAREYTSPDEFPS